jgi:hypothetical protein
VLLHPENQQKHGSKSFCKRQVKSGLLNQKGRVSFQKKKKKKEMMALAESRAQTHKKHTTKFYVEISEID